MRKWLVAGALVVSGCGNTVDVTAPPISIGADVGASGGGTQRRPEVWLIPAPHSRDMLEMFTNPERWPNARARITTFGLFQANTFPTATHPQHVPNFYESFAAVGAFSKLTAWGKDINLEAGAVKPYSCGDMAWMDVWNTKGSVYGVTQAGGRVRYISMDEPFTAAMRGGIEMTDDSSLRPCGFTMQQTARQVRAYIDAIHSDIRTLPPGAIGTYLSWMHDRPEMTTAFPDVQVGLIEPYPEFSIAQIKDIIRALEAEGVRLPHFHIDIDMYRTLREKHHLSKDLRELAAFLKDKKIIFGVIIWGERGLSEETYYEDAAEMALHIRNAMGAPDRLIFESWARYLPARPVDDVRTPLNLPETDPTRHTAIMNRGAALFDR